MSAASTTDNSIERTPEDIGIISAGKPNTSPGARGQRCVKCVVAILMGGRFIVITIIRAVVSPVAVLELQHYSWPCWR